MGRPCKKLASGLNLVSGLFSRADFSLIGRLWKVCVESVFRNSSSVGCSVKLKKAKGFLGGLCIEIPEVSESSEVMNLASCFGEAHLSSPCQQSFIYMERREPINKLFEDSLLTPLTVKDSVHSLTCNDWSCQLQ